MRMFLISRVGATKANRTKILFIMAFFRLI